MGINGGRGINSGLVLGGSGINIAGSGEAPFSFGNALEFDGTDDFVSFSTIPTNTNYSFSAWIYTGSSWGPNSYKMIAGSITSNGYIGLRNVSGFIQLSVFNCEFRNTNLTSIIANTNTWYHLVLTKTGSVSKAYINGVFQSNGLVNSFPIDLIGKYNSGLNLNGRLDEIAIWHTELTPTEVSNLYNLGSGDFATNYQAADLIAYWRMNGSGTDTTAVDEQGNYDGTLNNFPASGMWVAH